MEKLAMCRVCLAEGIRMYSIASTHLREVYEALTLKPFETKDIRPIRVCYICCGRLQNCYLFRNSCLQSEEMFTTMLNSNEFTLQTSRTQRLTIDTVVHLSIGGALQGPMEVHKVKKECSWSEDDAGLEQSDIRLDYDTLGLSSECDPPLEIVKQEPDELDTHDKAVEQGNTGLDYDRLGLSSKCNPLLEIGPDSLDTGASVTKKPRFAKQNCKDIPSNNLKRSEQDVIDEMKTQKAKSVKKKVRAPLKKYSTESLNQALASVRNNEMTAFKASRMYKIPYQTLLDKIKNTHPNSCGPPPVLTKEEEEIIVNWIHHMDETGFLVTREQLLHTVGTLVKELNRPNPFTNGIPGRHWYDAFLRRNNVKLRLNSAITIARVDPTEHKIRQWFDSVRMYLEDSNCLEILQDPTRIFNCEESAFFVSPTGHAVLARRGKRGCRASSNEIENLTLSLGASADGKLLPIQAVLPYKQIPLNILQKYPKTWVIGKSDSGWMTCQIFHEYITNSFNGFLLKDNIKKPVLLFLDGHFPHLSQLLTTFCKENGIILVPLLPSSIPAIHPLEVAVFHDLKKAWIESVYDWRMANKPRMLGKENFAPILVECIQRTLKPENVINGFRHAGLFPFDQNAVNYEKLFKSGSRSDSRSTVTTDFDDEKLVLEPSSTGENSYIISQF